MNRRQAGPLSANTIEENRLRFKLEDDEFWLFGYGSLIFKADFVFSARQPASINGWARRFWQGSHDHRGTEDSPGRVVTLVEQPGAVCHGMAYQIDRDQLGYLDHREKNGYLQFMTALTFGDDNSSQGLVYIATEENSAFLGEAPIPDIARQILDSVGPSGKNSDYLLQLARELRVLGAMDDHVFAVEEALLELGRSSS